MFKISYFRTWKKFLSLSEGVTKVNKVNQIRPFNTLGNKFMHQRPFSYTKRSFGETTEATDDPKSTTRKLTEAHESYGLFRIGQEIGYQSTIMQDPQDITKVNNLDCGEDIHFYKGVPEHTENMTQDMIEIRVSKRHNAPWNSPTGSFVQIIYPFTTNARLASRYRKFGENHITVGKVLEEIDVLWGECAWRFIKGNNEGLSEVGTVTAAVDQIKFLTPPMIDQDLKINSYVIYTGKSTIYVKSDIYQRQKDSDEWSFKGHTIFIMAVRKGTAAYMIPSMVIEKEEDIKAATARKLLGAELKNYIIGMDHSMYKQPPDHEESKLLFELFKKKKFDYERKFKTVSETVLDHNLFMVTQKTNVYGKIFGGYLLKYATEWAMLNARRFTEEFNPEIFCIDATKFIKPVEIGHVIKFKSKVIYTDKKMFRIAISALDVCSNDKEGDITNEFHFVIIAKKDVTEIVPDNYFEALHYLEGKRRTEHLLNY
jgi:acyl-coenzyme A thioesterase 9